MLKKLNVYYNGWGEYWLWGTLVSSTAITGRPLIAFEYSAEAISKGLELSSYLLPLKGDPIKKTFLHSKWDYQVIYMMHHPMAGCAPEFWWLFSPSLLTFQLSSFPTSPGYNNGHPKYD